MSNGRIDGRSSPKCISTYHNSSYGSYSSYSYSTYCSNSFNWFFEMNILRYFAAIEQNSTRKDEGVKKANIFILCLNMLFY